MQARQLEKQLAEQRKALASKEKEAGTLAKDLRCEQAAVDGCFKRCAHGSLKEEPWFCRCQRNFPQEVNISRIQRQGK